MSKWIARFLKDESPSIYRTDNTDKPHDGGHLSVLSVPFQGVLNENLENMPEALTDKTDKPHDGEHLSVLSVPSQGVLDENLENMPEPCTDKTDKPHDGGHLSVLSVPSQGHLDRNLENMPGSGPDKPDRLDPSLNLSGLSGPSQGHLNKTSVFPYEGFFLLDDFEERLAIAEYDGHQSPVQAQRIAYQDALIAVLSTLSYEEENGYYDDGWLTRRIKAAQSWLVASRAAATKIRTSKL